MPNGGEAEQWHQVTKLAHELADRGAVGRTLEEAGVSLEHRFSCISNPQAIGYAQTSGWQTTSNRETLVQTSLRLYCLQLRTPNNYSHVWRIANHVQS